MSAQSQVCVATYSRTIRASVPRIWENVLDWEHLPWLHRRSFTAVELLEQTPIGWRAWVTPASSAGGQKSLIEISTDQPNLQYWSRVLAGQGRGSEVLTVMRPIDGQATSIVVEFWISELLAKKKQTAGDAYIQLYTRLWDEDERMMIRRQELLNQGWQDVKKLSFSVVRNRKMR